MSAHTTLAQHRTYQRTRYWQRRKAGRCTVCGTAVTDGRAACPTCRRYKNTHKVKEHAS